ncbi:hypothetical protein GCM10009096_27150 [Parasphingorhabdus litoris]|uniref:Uncharacterized protein n=1 Tax=Parasphingorhabdus litoris TaxID=394733 RepID=A0ABN1AT95_9SPHN|nr:hypothetical protein [Parasphingorhabdus litoris]
MAIFAMNNLLASVLAVASPQLPENSEDVWEKMAQTAPAEPDGEASQKLLGRYYLRGVMETASGLQLSEDGSFQWYLSVGALDILTGGRWSLQDGKVTLVYDPPAEGARYDPLGTVVMKIDGDNLVPPANMGRGIYVKAQPRPESE